MMQNANSDVLHYKKKVCRAKKDCNTWPPSLNRLVEIVFCCWESGSSLSCFLCETPSVKFWLASEECANVFGLLLAFKPGNVFEEPEGENIGLAKACPSRPRIGLKWSTRRETLLRTSYGAAADNTVLSSRIRICKGMQMRREETAMDVSIFFASYPKPVLRCIRIPEGESFAFLFHFLFLLLNRVSSLFHNQQQVEDETKRRGLVAPQETRQKTLGRYRVTHFFLSP